MSQSRAQSAVEAMINVIAGYGIALATQLVVFPVVGIEARAGQMMAVGLAFTLVSLIRSYALRRLFDRLSSRRT